MYKHEKAYSYLLLKETPLPTCDAASISRSARRVTFPRQHCRLRVGSHGSHGSFVWQRPYTGQHVSIRLSKQEEDLSIGFQTPRGFGPSDRGGCRRRQGERGGIANVAASFSAEQITTEELPDGSLEMAAPVIGASGTWQDGGAVIDPDVALLESFSTIANIERAWIVKPRGGGLDVILAMSQRNLLANVIRRFISTVRFSDSASERLPSQWSPFPLETSGVTLLAPSPSGRKMLLVRNGQQPPGNSKEAAPPVKFEVWGRGHLLKEVLVPSSMHRALYTDGWFEAVCWSPDETRIAYVAEEASTPRPVFGRRVANGREGTLSPPSTTGMGAGEGRGGRTPAGYGAGAGPGTSDLGTWKGHGDWMEDWGERYTGKGRPSLFVVDIESSRVQKVEGIPTGVSAGQVIWVPNVEASMDASVVSKAAGMLVFVGWSAKGTNFNNTPKKLGMVYCYNRPSALYAVPAPSFTEESLRGGGGGGGGGEERSENGRMSAIKLTKDMSSAFSPRLSPDGRILAFLSSHAAVDSGLHAGTASLHTLEWPANGRFHVQEEDGVAVQLQVRTVVDVVPRGSAAAGGGFPGLYTSGFIKNPWLSDGRTLVISSTWRSTQSIVTVNVETGLVQRVSPGPQSYNLLDIRDDLIVVSASAPNRPPVLSIAQANRDTSVLLWKEVPYPQSEYPAEVDAALKSMRYEIYQVPVPVIERSERLSPGAAEPFEALLLYKAMPAAEVGTNQEQPSSSTPLPLIVIPHGGPHSVFVTSYAMSHAYLCALGYAVLAVNYRGSLGFGEEAVQSLPGNVGRQDVADVLQALGFAVQHSSVVDRTRVAIIGGSHGGFLAAHLIGQAPDLFRTAVMRNPVCNFSSMVGITDIPDWCFTEAMGGVVGAKAYTEIPSVEDLQAFYSVSPIAHIANVKVPTLFLLGKEDRRVPMSNALQYVHALRSRGLEARVVVFPEDNHALDKPQTEFETWVTIAGWLKQHLR